MMIFIIGTLILAVLLGISFLIPSRCGKSGNGKIVQTSDNATKGAKVYSRAEVSSHNKRTDCWIIIKDKVYDVTPYVEEHPGGDSILVHAGDDSTEGFFGPQHATRVSDMIEDFYVGELQH